MLILNFRIEDDPVVEPIPAVQDEAQDIKLVDVIVDAGESAKSLDRPGIQAALKMLKGGKADALIVMKLDRLTRSVKDLGHLCDSYFSDGKPWSLLSVSDAIDTRSASGKLLLNVLTSVAQWEREAIAERTREVVVHLRQQGIAVGRASYGTRYEQPADASGRCLAVEDQQETEVIALICQLREAGLSLFQICEKLTSTGYQTKLGKRWHPKVIRSILQRAGYETGRKSKRRTNSSAV